MNIQILQNINLISILFIGIIFFNLPITITNILIVFLFIIILEIFYKKIFNKSNLTVNSALNTWTWILFFLKTSNPLFLILAVFIAISSKYIIKYKWKHFLNPSNLAIVLILLLFPNYNWLISEQWERNFFFIGYIILFWLYILYKWKLLKISLWFIITYILWYLLIINPSYDKLFFDITNISIILFVFFMLTDPSIIPKNNNKYIYWSIIALIYIFLLKYITASYLLLISYLILSLIHPLIYRFKNKVIYPLFMIMILLVVFIWPNISNNINNNINKLEYSDNLFKNNKDEENIYFDFKTNINIINNDKNNWNLWFIKQNINISNNYSDNLLYYKTNWLNKSSIASWKFNNDDLLDIFTISEKWLSIWLNNGNWKFDFKYFDVWNKSKTWDIFYTAVDYNFDWFADIITNNSIDYNVDIFINNNWNWTFIKNKTNIKQNWYRWIWFADFNNDFILDIIIPTNCENIDIWDNKICGDNKLFISNNKYHYKEINLDLIGNKWFNEQINGHTLTTFYWEVLKNKKSLYIWNDFSTPDLIYNNNNWNISIDTKYNDYIPNTTFQTMSCDNWDINNDGLFDIFCTEMLYSDNIYNNKIKTYDSCLTAEKPLTCYAFNQLAKSVNELNLQWCIDTENDVNNYLIKNKLKITEKEKELIWFQIWTCINQVIMDTSMLTFNIDICNKISDSLLKNKCINKIWFIKENNESLIHWNINLSKFPKQKQSNVLLINDGNKFVDQTNKFNLLRSDWSWNSQIFDINNDNYNDIYVANWTQEDIRITPNKLFINNNWNEMKEFINSEIWILDPTYVYTYWDFDNDNDNDIILKSLYWELFFIENTIWWANMQKLNLYIKKSWQILQNITNIKYSFYDINDKLLFVREKKLSWWYNSINSLDLLFNKSYVDYILIDIFEKTYKINIRDIVNNNITIHY